MGQPHQQKHRNQNPRRLSPKPGKVLRAIQFPEGIGENIEPSQNLVTGRGVQRQPQQEGASNPGPLVLKQIGQGHRQYAKENHCGRDCRNIASVKARRRFSQRNGGLLPIVKEISHVGKLSLIHI